MNSFQSIVDERQIISNVVFLHPSKLPTWEKVTAYVQNVLKYFSNACVVSGPLFLPTKNKKLSHVTYEVVVWMGGLDGWFGWVVWMGGLDGWFGWVMVWMGGLDGWFG